MTKPTKAMREAAADLVADMPGVGSIHSEDVEMVLAGMAHAAALIRADIAALSDYPKTPSTAVVQTFNLAVPKAKSSVTVRLESGLVGRCYGEPSSRTAVLIATDRALIQERIADGKWLK